MNLQLVVLASLVAMSAACGPSKEEKKQKREIDELRTQLENRDANIESKDGEIGERNAEIEEQKSELAQRGYDLGNKKREIAQLSQKVGDLENKTKNLDGHLARTAAKLTEKENELKEKETAYQASSDAIAALNAQKQQLTDKVATLSTETAEQKVELAKLVVQLDEVGKELVAKEKEALVLSTEIADLKTDQAELNKTLEEAAIASDKEQEFIESLLGDTASELLGIAKSIQGLWKKSLSTESAESHECKLLLKIGGASFKKAVVCQKNSEVSVQYEWGYLVGIETAAGSLVPQKVSSRSFVNTCSAGYLSDFGIVNWRGEIPMVIELANTGTDTVADLMQDNHTNGIDCPSVLANPNLPGLELDVAACEVFAMSLPKLRALDNTGCVSKDTAGNLIFN